MRIHRDELGQTIILVALSLPILLGFVGFATDVGLLFMDKRQIQTAADAAAIAGAQNLNYGSYSTAAKDASASNGYTNGSNGVTVTVNDPPQWPSSNYVGQTGYVEATVSKTESTIFLSLFGHPSVTVTARAVATNQASGAGCLYTVGTTGTDFTDNGGGNSQLSAPNCGLVVDSDMVLHGNTKLSFGSIGVVGTYTKTGNSGSVSPTPTAGIAPESDPLNYLPQYTFTNTTTGHGSNATTTYSVGCTSGYDCSRSAISGTTACQTNNSSGYTAVAGSTLLPGCYANLTFPNSGTVTLSAGLYVIDGDLTFGNGNVTGSGVTFYYGGNVSYGSGTYTLSPPNDPSLLWNGIIFAEDISDTSGISFGGNSNTVINGVVYAPGTAFTMSGNPSITLNADFVVKKITLNGDVTLTSYASLSGVSNPLSSIALVE